MKKKYDIENLISIFDKHYIEFSKNLKKNNYEEDSFNLALALRNICQEIKALKDDRTNRKPD